MRRRLLSLWILWIGCQGSAWADTVEPAPEFETVFRRQSGWTGADGTYSYPLGHGQTLWGFSDTFFGEVRDGSRVEPFRFVNNSMVAQSESDFVFLPAPVFTPPQAGHWFWLFDAADQEILLGEFRGDGAINGFGFRQVGLWSARFQLDSPPTRVRVRDLRPLPFFLERDGATLTFGPAILNGPAWLHLFGVMDRDGQRWSVLARTPRGQLGQPGCWQFYGPNGWTNDPWSVSPLFAGAAMEASVHRTRSGELLYVGTDHGGMGPAIIARAASRPEGPWSEPHPIFEAPEHQGDVFAYNAKAHPEQSSPNRLLISYNVNTSDLRKVVTEADLYRPRFLWWTPTNLGWLPATTPDVGAGVSGRGEPEARPWPTE